MRAVIGGVIAAALAAGAVWSVAGPTLAGDPARPYQIYIFDSAEGYSVYAFTVGERAAAARAERCVGRVLNDPRQVVADLRERAAAKDEELGVVWISGEGSRVNLGRCDATEDVGKEDGQNDSLVVVRDASARQARHLIREAPLSAADRDVIINALGLDRQPARR